MVQGADTLIGSQVEIEADMVVLATAVVPRVGSKDLAQRLGIAYDQYGFYNEYHPKLKPVETVTGGIFLSGACIGPMDVPTAVAQDRPSPRRSWVSSRTTRWRASRSRPR